MSLCISRQEYNVDSGTLTLEFPGPGGRGGVGIYEYYNVPVYEAAGMEVASSKGEYFNRNIRDHYSYMHVSGFEQMGRDYQDSLGSALRGFSGI